MYSFMHIAWYFDHEMMMLNWMELKFCMHNLDTLRNILVYGLWFFHSWIMRYDLIIGGVTICVTPFLSWLLNFCYHAIWTQNDLKFCMLTLLDVRFTCEFLWNIWMCFQFDWEFPFCLTNCGLFVSHDFNWFVKFLICIGWTWNFVEWL